MSNRVITHRTRKNMPRYKKVRHEHQFGHTITREKVGDDLVEFTLTVDIDGILDRLAAKAWRNASSRSKALWGTVDIRAKLVDAKPVKAHDD